MRPSTDKLQPSRPTLTAIENHLDSGNLPLLTALRRLALDLALPVYLVGGPVRDLLLGRPVKDLDFVVEGDALSLARRLAGQLGGKVIVHPRFGTATVVRDGARIDLVTARREVYPRPGALPKVAPGSIADDLARRDFSVNALARSLVDRRPRLLAPHGGDGDLRRGLIRTLHPASFADDPTRLLRAVRYEQRLGFRLEPDTETQLGNAVAQGYLNTVSGDRLRNELERILKEEQPGPALIRAAGLGLLPAIHPALSGADCLERWAAEMPQIAPETDTGSDTGSVGDIKPLTWLAALAYPLAAGDGDGIIRRLNLPKSWAQVVRDTIELRELEGEIAAPSLPPSRLCSLLERREPAVVYAVAGLTGSLPARRALLRYQAELRQITPFLNGRDLLEMGVPPGPPVGQALAQLRAARRDGQVHTEAGERQWVQRQLQQLQQLRQLQGEGNGQS